MKHQQAHTHLRLEGFLHIGMRKWKSVLAILTGFLIWQGLRLFFPQLEIHPYYIYIYSVIEIRGSSEKTKEMSSRRAKSTLIGLATGLSFLLLGEHLGQLIHGQWLRVIMELALILLGLLLTLTMAEKARCKSSCGIAAVIFIVVIVAHTSGDVYLYALQRLVQTFIGLFVAWLINVKLFPYPGNKQSS